MRRHADDHTVGQKPTQGHTPSGESLIGSSKASEIKAALTAARNLAAGQDARRDQGALVRAGLAQRSPILRANQRTAERLLTSVLEKSGFDFDKFEEIRAQNRAESHRILEAQKADAVKPSAEAKATFRSAVESRRKIMEHLAASPGTPGIFQVQQVVLDAPFLIWPTPYWIYGRLFFDDYHIEPWKSWAKFKVDAEGDTVGSSDVGFGEVNFYFLWENQSDKYAVINVDTWLMLNGFGKVDIPDRFLGAESSSLTIGASLTLLEWWNQPPTWPSTQADQNQTALNLDLEKGDLGYCNCISPWGTRVFRTYDLRYSLELVPPQGVVVFEVGPSIGYSNMGGGSIEADFDTGDFEVMCPFLQIQILGLWP